MPIASGTIVCRRVTLSNFSSQQQDVTETSVHWQQYRQEPIPTLETSIAQSHGLHKRGVLKDDKTDLRLLVRGRTSSSA